jgi:hypothetical protein
MTIIILLIGNRTQDVLLCMHLFWGIVLMATHVPINHYDALTRRFLLTKFFDVKDSLKPSFMPYEPLFTWKT